MDGHIVREHTSAIIWSRIAPERAGDPLWLPATIGVQVGGLTLLLLVALLWPAARSMRLSLAMLLAVLVGWRVLTPLVTQSAAWAQWQASQSIGMSLATSRLQWLPPAALMTLVAMIAGLRRADLYLVRGDWTAPVMREPLFPFRGWRWFPGMFVLVLSLWAASFVLGEFVFEMRGWVTTLGPDYNKAERVLIHSPGIVAGSFLNAAFEEFIFRAALLACFIPAVGTRHALWLTVVLFGLEHWPTAGIGIILGFYGSWLYAKSITETRGCSWAMVQHIIGDIPIYAVVAMARP